MNIKPIIQVRSRAYSLAEVLIASAILMIGVSAASSLSLTINTQEEIVWKVSRGANMLETAALLYQQGMDASEVVKLIPLDSSTTLSVVSPGEADESITGVGTMRGVTFRVSIETVEDVGSWSAGTWTGGSDATNPTRTIDARVYRSTIDRF